MENKSFIWPLNFLHACNPGEGNVQSLRNFTGLIISNNLLIASVIEVSPYNNSWIIFWVFN